MIHIVVSELARLAANALIEISGENIVRTGCVCGGDLKGEKDVQWEQIEWLRKRTRG